MQRLSPARALQRSWQTAAGVARKLTLVRLAAGVIDGCATLGGEFTLFNGGVTESYFLGGTKT